ncbi:MAG: 1-acyl-sn-glycerol-3-phosphate acyltransferase [Legionellales bacterium]|nr:1-acyl-sn-glycerol-3-phosphate acyltransferase [Legionellales bacterium]
MNFLREIWRVGLTALFFVFFALGGVILAYVVLPVFLFLSRNQEAEKYKAQYAIHQMFRFMIYMLQSLGLINFTFKNFEQLKEDQGCLFIANHPTLIDYVAIISKLPRCDNLVKESLWKNRFIKRIISKADYIPNQESTTIIERIKATLNEGNNLLMFPEGTRTIPGETITLKRGAAQLAIRANAPIRLIHISCKPPFLTKQTKWYQLPFEKPQFTLRVVERIEPGDYLIKTGFPSLAARELTRDLEKHLRGEN